MGSKEAKKNNRLVDQERERGMREHDQAMGYLLPERHEAKKLGDAERQEVWGGYKKFADGSAFAGMPTGGGGGGGGYDPLSYSLGGGWGEMRNVARGLASGGMSGDAMERMRANGTFDEYNRTGGISADQEAMMRGKGIAGIGGYFDAARNLARRKATASGANLSGALSAMDERMAREQARAVSDASRDTELGIFDRRDAGRRWGAEGLSGAETNIQGIASQNKIAGMGGLGQYAGAEQDILNANVSEANSARRASAAAGAAASADAAADARWRAGMSMDALDRMSGLYEGMGSGQQNMYDNRLMEERGMSSDQFQRSNQQRMDYNPNVSAWDRAMQIGNMAAGIGGAIMTGGASTAIGAGLKAAKGIASKQAPAIGMATPSGNLGFPSQRGYSWGF